MESNYYYLVASLPYLKFEQAPPLSKEDFILECAKWLAPNDLKQIKNLDINDFTIKPKDLPIIKEWKAFDLGLRQELARIRHARHTSPGEKAHSYLKDVFDEPNPLFMEKNLTKKRWAFLEEREFGCHFDMNAIIIYFLKLQFLERLASFNKEEGMDLLKSLCEAKYE